MYEDLLVDRIVVGVDGSAPSQAAVRWAARWASHEKTPLTVLAAYGPPVILGLVGTMIADVIDTIHRSAREHATQAAEQARRLAPGLQVDEALSDRVPAHALIEATSSARMVVLGRHGGSGTRLGDVADQVVTHAQGPVVVVPDEPPAGADAPVVAAVDTSRHSKAVLRFAFDMAKSTGRPLEVLHAWEVDYVYRTLPVPVEEADLESDRERQSAAIEAMMTPIAAQYPDVTVTHRTYRGEAAAVLREGSSSASLLVVGRRGHGGFVGLLLGSTSRRIAQVTKCPLAVVPS